MKLYKVTNTKNGKVYIGQTNRSIEERWKEHCKPALRERSYLSNAIQKYGKENFAVEELAKCETQEELDKQEDELINSHNSMSPNGYNLRHGGMGGKLSEEAKEKVRQARIGKKHSNESKKKMSESNKGITPVSARPVIGTNLKTGEKIYLEHAYADKRFHYNCIHRCAKGERKQHKGFKWNYVE